MTESKAMILGCSGLTLTLEEIALYKAEQPWGFILFGRNIGDAQQITDLVASMREAVGRPDAPVLIDRRRWEGPTHPPTDPPVLPERPGLGRNLSARS